MIAGVIFNERKALQSLQSLHIMKRLCTKRKKSASCNKRCCENCKEKRQSQGYCPAENDVERLVMLARKLEFFIQAPVPGYQKDLNIYIEDSELLCREIGIVSLNIMSHIEILRQFLQVCATPENKPFFKGKIVTC